MLTAAPVALSSTLDYHALWNYPPPQQWQLYAWHAYWPRAPSVGVRLYVAENNRLHRRVRHTEGWCSLLNYHFSLFFCLFVCRRTQLMVITCGRKRVVRESCVISERRLASWRPQWVQTEHSSACLWQNETMSPSFVKTHARAFDCLFFWGKIWLLR